MRVYILLFLLIVTFYERSVNPLEVTSAKIMFDPVARHYNHSKVALNIKSTEQAVFS